MDKLSPREAPTAADGMVLAALTGLLFCVYLLTASLTFVSDDELFLFDAAESWARHGNILLSETADLKWPGESDVEPIQPLLVAPVYLLVNSFEGVGNVHGTMLFNPAVTALTASLVFLYLRRLEYARSTSAAAALSFGLTTIAWPYAKTFFRESLATFVLFGAAYALLSWREAVAQKQRPASLWLLAALAAGVISMFTKEAALVGLPILLLILVPGRVELGSSPKEWLRAAALVAAAIGLAAFGLWLFGRYFNSGRFDVAGRLDQMSRNFPIAQQGFFGFLISPGKSLFVYSPVLVLALAAPLIGGRRRFDTSWPLVLMTALVVVYALVRGELWWGGTNWGPRYMVPLTPFLMVAAAPAIDAAVRGRNRLARAVFAGLALLGLAVQIGGVAVKLDDYYTVVGSIKEGGPWTLALWTPYYSAVLGHWRLLGAEAPDFAWLQALPEGPAWMVPVVVGALMAAFVLAIWFGLNRIVQRRLMLLTAVGGFLLTGAATWFSLHAIYYDQRYGGADGALHQLNAALAKIDAPDPVIFLNNRAYFNFMLNYYKGRIVWYTLELNPRELLQPGQPRPSPATDPETLVNSDARSVVEYFASKRQTALLVMEHGPFTPESPRPLEWWMSRNYFYEGVQEFGPAVRLVQFSTARAPAPTAAPAHAADYRLNDTIALAGWDAQPDGMPVRPGSVLNISTQWQAVASPGADYKIGTYLITPQGNIAVQVDTIPVNGFWPTISWQAGDVVRHNVAFVIPKDLAPGFYEVWTLAYSPLDGARLPVQDSSGTAIRDHIVLFTVEVTR